MAILKERPSSIEVEGVSPNAFECTKKSVPVYGLTMGCFILLMPGLSWLVIDQYSNSDLKQSRERKTWSVRFRCSQNGVE
jgi:hypothetical protein